MEVIAITEAAVYAARKLAKYGEEVVLTGIRYDSGQYKKFRVWSSIGNFKMSVDVNGQIDNWEYWK